ncbi:tether containing UBX domain for GLUT4 [Marchantia polymorpha subsp. ruderalis]|uniref:UBX domain-containing protein n=3 Tax=Marchantia polymorpha TaxID=3197 RepID=A0AAF6BDC7_MARPO|nr:hypothetical protein MARPO_0078s0021 [Marchantia polymorpha]BBN10011.1 hypothetical protein Mp_5g00200 [Marchantia polymorpha subsp. ruderalis]|eukprot:PTQ34605.1 hypothetical protein MARPO_0078s0021 [Marchantia polymorpha]
MMDTAEGEVIDPAQAQVNVTSMESANYPSFFIRKFMGRPVIVRPGSKLLPSLDMLSAVATTVGREVHVFLRPASVPPSQASSAAGPEPDDFFEFTAEDYARMMAHKKKEEVFLKTKKIRDAEEAARRARITKAVVRVQFPDNFVLEATFHPSDPISLLIDLLRKVVMLPNETFYIYTAPPKQRLKNLQQSMYEAGLAPGALVYFSYESPRDMDGPYLRPEIAALRDLHLLEHYVTQQEPTSQSGVTDAVSESSESVVPKQEAKRSTGSKPKWFKQR